jgi:hypothetical protein
MCRSIRVCGKRGFCVCYVGGASVEHPDVCSRRNDPYEPCERALCVSALFIYSLLDLSHDFLMLYDIRSNSLMGMLNCCSWSGFKGSIRFALSWYVALIFSSKACCLYSATALVSSLWDSSFLKSHWRRECFRIDVFMDLSKASIISFCHLGSRIFPHFREIHPFRKFPQPFFV